MSTATFINVGERTNIPALPAQAADPRRRLRPAHRRRTAGGDGAQIIDINMDEGLLDSGRGGGDDEF